MITEQFRIFFISYLCGTIISFVYDILKAKRETFKTSTFIISIEDFIFWISSAFVVFAVFYTSNDAEIRGYLFIGLIIGALLYNTLISKYIIKSIKFLLKLFLKLFIYPIIKIQKFIKTPIIFFIRYPYRKFIKKLCFIKVMFL